MDLDLLADVLGNQLQVEGEGGAARPKVLDDLSVEGIITHLRKIMTSDDKRKVIVMTGAGISTAAGIPDFRSPGTGLYHNLQKYNLPSPQAVFEIGYFRHNPKPFFDLAKELYPALFKPTLSHYFIRLLAEKGLLLRNFTQNIDTLERQAGIEADFIVEAHGAFHAAHCVDCGHEHSHQYVRDVVFSGGVPMCTQPGCARVPAEGEDEPYHGLVKPDIVFFGEALPDRFAKCAVEDTRKCELLIIIGTSLVVHPFASLVDRVPNTCPRLLINLEKVGEGNPLMRLLGMGGGLDFNPHTGYRDVFMKTKCDDGCLQLAQMLGWADELTALHKEHHEQLESEIQAVKREIESAGKARMEKKDSADSQEGKASADSQEGKDSADSHEGKGNTDSQEEKDGADSQEGKAGADSQEGKDSADSHEGKDGADSQEGKGDADSQEEKDGADSQEKAGADSQEKAGTDSQEGKAGADSQEGKDGADSQKGKDGADSQEGKDGADSQEGKDGADSQEGKTDEGEEREKAAGNP